MLPGHICRGNGKKAKFFWLLNQGIAKDTSGNTDIKWRWMTQVYATHWKSFIPENYTVCVESCGHVCCEDNFSLRSSLCKSLFLPLLVLGRSQTHLVLEQNSWHQYLQCCCIYQNIVPWSPEKFPFMHVALFWCNQVYIMVGLQHHADIVLLWSFCPLHPIYVYKLITGLWVRIWLTYLEIFDINLVFYDMYCP